MELLHLSDPSGTEWQLLIAATVVLLGPLILEKARIPGLIGLLLGGLIIGPNVLGVVPADGGIVKEIGEVGLVYLMFTAGLELDLGVFAKYRKQAITFALLTFTFPMLFGILVGLAFDMEVAAAVLLGSLLASHTLITYPVIRRLGLASNTSVATSVGATVLTDTLALIVLAVISGQATGDASGATLVVQVTLGLGLLAAFCFLLLPPLTRYWFATVGRQPTLRYTFAFAVMLAGSTLAEVVHIEPIVGAFFTGLALNRLVPNEGDFMEHIEFFGSALLIPIFLVSVGTVIDPSVMFDRGTLELAAAFCAACLAGKLVAAAICRPAFGASWDEVGVIFSLSASQTAATLAATFVGLDIGLFDTSVVNAVMILILVSLVASSMTATFFGPRVPKPPVDLGRLGRSVLVRVDANEPAGPAVRIAARLAAADGGVVRPLVVVTPGQLPPSVEIRERAEQAVGALGIEPVLEVRHDDSVAEGVAHSASSLDSSLVLDTASGQAWLPAVSAEASELVLACETPVAFVWPGAAELKRVVLLLANAQAERPGPAARLAIELVVRLRASGLPVVVVAGGMPAADLLTPLGEPTVEQTDIAAWSAASAAPEDVLVVPGGHNGAQATATAVAQGESKGSTVIAITDADALSRRVTAAETLGIVTG
jgi:Kef-type K+ transport system membrane component KefB